MDSLINVTNNIHDSLMSLNLTFIHDYINDVSALNTNAFNNIYPTSMYYVYNTADIVTNAFNITAILNMSNIYINIFDYIYIYSMFFFNKICDNMLISINVLILLILLWSCYANHLISSENKYIIQRIDDIIDNNNGVIDSLVGNDIEDIEDNDDNDNVPDKNEIIIENDISENNNDNLFLVKLNELNNKISIIEKDITDIHLKLTDIETKHNITTNKRDITNLINDNFKPKTVSFSDNISFETVPIVSSNDDKDTVLINITKQKIKKFKRN